MAFGLHLCGFCILSSLPCEVHKALRQIRLALLSQVEDINARFGVDIATSQPADVAAAYGQFLEWSIPRGDAPLTGSEADAIRRCSNRIVVEAESHPSLLHLCDAVLLCSSTG